MRFFHEGIFLTLFNSMVDEKIKYVTMVQESKI